MGFLERMMMRIVMIPLMMMMITINIFISAAAAEAEAEAQVLVHHPPNHCNDRDYYCGNMSIPYPFSISERCARESKFFIDCTTGQPILGENLLVTNISIETYEITIMGLISSTCPDQNGKSREWSSLTVHNYIISSSKNKLTVIGCNSYAYLSGTYGSNETNNYSIGCISRCDSIEGVSADGNCSGIGCCQIQIPDGLRASQIESYRFPNVTPAVESLSPCTYSFLVEENRFDFNKSFITNFAQDRMPVVLEWAINNTQCGSNAKAHPIHEDGYYYCQCNPGYSGNPYLSNNCTDIDECNTSTHNCKATEKCVNKQGSFKCEPKDQLLVIKITVGVAVGLVAFVICSSSLYLVLRKRKLIKLKEKFFQQNGGIILQQKLSQQQHQCSNETARIFSEQELKKATLNYDSTTIIGQGGFGTVYKGFLADKKIVAIKKSKNVEQSQIEQFINEVIVLSQINHRNVVKLLGCCLETEVPLLVYEFVPNGTLFEHIHDANKVSNFPWKVRLGIAAETAGALSYLHSAASTPIIHRDVKSSNILLDNYTAKVSDFGASRLVPLDQIEVATMVQGTLGYLDPEYLYTNQLTEKSDVYSFGVVPVELLTGRKALMFDRPEDERNLAQYFHHSLKEGRLFEVIESNLNKEENKEQIKEVAELAKRCLSLRGDDRPSMKEVAMELEGLRKTEKHPRVNEEVMNMEEIEYLLDETSNANDGSITTSAYDSVRNPGTLDFSGR